MLTVERKRAALAETGPHGADVVIECVGHPAAVNEGIELCRDGGKYLVLPPHHDRGHDRNRGTDGFIATFSDSYLGYAVIRIVPAGAADVERAVAYARTIGLYSPARAENPRDELRGPVLVDHGLDAAKPAAGGLDHRDAAAAGANDGDP